MTRQRFDNNEDCVDHDFVERIVDYGTHKALLKNCKHCGTGEVIKAVL